MLHVLREVLGTVVPRGPGDAPVAHVRIHLFRQHGDVGVHGVPEVGVLQPRFHLGLVALDIGDVLVRVGDADLDDPRDGRTGAVAVVQPA